MLQLVFLNSVGFVKLAAVRNNQHRRLLPMRLSCWTNTPFPTQSGAVLAARETPELQTDVIMLGLAAVGTRLSAPARDRLNMVINMEVAHLRGARPMKRDTVDVLRMVALPPALTLPAHSTNNVVPLSKYRRVINE